MHLPQKKTFPNSNIRLDTHRPTKKDNDSHRYRSKRPREGVARHAQNKLKPDRDTKLSPH